MKQKSIEMKKMYIVLSLIISIAIIAILHFASNIGRETKKEFAHPYNPNDGFAVKNGTLEYYGVEVYGEVVGCTTDNDIDQIDETINSVFKSFSKNDFHTNSGKIAIKKALLKKLQKVNKNKKVKITGVQLFDYAEAKYGA